MPDTPTPGQPETPLQQALLRRGDVLDGPRVLQLHALWSSELASLPADVVADVVDVRLQKPEYAHFLKPGHAQQAAQQAAQQPAREVTLRDYPGLRSDDEARRVHAAGLQRAEALKATMAARRSGPGASPGLAGTYL